jgi:methylenetetrahydrofolate dehydrogenase (NADP+)/methenyltetrahydrofolate cyclohydrolase
MTARLLDGKKLANQLQEEIKINLQGWVAKGRAPPGLVVIQVGTDAASSVYVRNKHVAASSVGMRSEVAQLSADTTESELLERIGHYNRDLATQGILVQMPLPKGINPQTIMDAIDPRKDVDGFHPLNMGRLCERRPFLRPCTPYGIMRLLQSIDFPFRTSHVTVVGASNIVGRPMGLELLLAGTTVTMCHRFTQDLPSHVRMSDAVIVAIGKPNFLKGDWLKPGCVVIDVGMNRLPDGSMTGDVDFASAKKVASWITPVPGGVGPMTVATLLENTWKALTL